MYLCVFPQEIQPGDHHKALLGRKVSVCTQLCVQCVCFPFISFMSLLLMLGLPQAWEQMSGIQIHKHNNIAMFSFPLPSLLTLTPLLSLLAKLPRVISCFYCHAAVFCPQSALVTFPLSLKVFRLTVRKVEVASIYCILLLVLF